MYPKYFGLREASFSITPDPQYLFLSEQHREALAHLLYGAGEGGGFVLLTGEVGTGKTTVCRCLLEKVPDEAEIVFILNPKLSALELLAAICDELNISRPVELSGTNVLVDLINRALLENHANGHRTVLIIDEAQNLAIDVLEQIRLLTNLETNKQKLLQIVLLGQPELRDKLKQPELEQLSQRISARHHLGPLNKEETRSYILHRLSVAGLSKPLFAEDAIAAIFRISGGVPRLINMICDRAMLGAYAKGLHQVRKKTVNTAAREIFGESSISSSGSSMPIYPRWQIGLLTLCICALVIIALNLTSNNASSNLEKSQSPLPQALGTAKNPREMDESPVLTTAPVQDDRQTVITEPWPGPADLATSQEQAFADLFKLWKLDFKGDLYPCQEADLHGLACLARQGVIGDLIRFDRPVILSMTLEQQEFHVLLKEMDNHLVTVVSGGRQQQRRIEEVVALWDGNFILLWRPPPGYRGSMRPGSKGMDVHWLAEQMAIIQGGQVVADLKDTYHAGLTRSVKMFQYDNGLESDGIAGKETLILVNSLAGVDVPYLRPHQNHDN